MTTNRKLKLFVIVTSLSSHDMNVKVTWHFFINQSQESHYHSWLEMEIQGNEAISSFKPFVRDAERNVHLSSAHNNRAENGLFWWHRKRRYMYICILKFHKARYTVLWLIQLEIRSSYCPSCKSVLPLSLQSMKLLSVVNGVKIPASPYFHALWLNIRCSIFYYQIILVI